MRKQNLVFLAVVASQMGATKCGQVLRDPGFDLWCGEELCAWKLERGEVKRVATWHESDAGVELVGTDVAIEQLTPVNSGDGECIRFDLVANVAESAEVYLNVDIEGDGTLEMHERIPTSHWKPLSYNFAVASPYDGIRFEITKRGEGEAVLANIGAQMADNQCNALIPLDPGPRRNGAMCTSGTECASGRCGASPTPVPSYPWVPSACLGCDDTTCATGEVCGLGHAFSPVFAVPVECVAMHAKQIGEQCIVDGECGSDLCVDNVCSSCRDTACGCHVAWPKGPHLCSNGGPGAPCGSQLECASGICRGEPRQQCFDDGRECHSPADCPFGTGDQALQNGACFTVGAQGGSCD
jgi:hypothetical protein